MKSRNYPEKSSGKNKRKLKNRHLHKLGTVRLKKIVEEMQAIAMMSSMKVTWCLYHGQNRRCWCECDVIVVYPQGRYQREKLAYSGERSFTTWGFHVTDKFIKRVPRFIKEKLGAEEL